MLGNGASALLAVRHSFPRLRGRFVQCLGGGCTEHAEAVAVVAMYVALDGAEPWWAGGITPDQ